MKDARNKLSQNATITAINDCREVFLGLLEKSKYRAGTYVTEVFASLVRKLPEKDQSLLFSEVGAMYLELGKPDEATRYCENALELIQKHRFSYEDEANCRHVLAKALLLRGDDRAYDHLLLVRDITRSLCSEDAKLYPLSTGAEYKSLKRELRKEIKAANTLRGYAGDSDEPSDTSRDSSSRSSNLWTERVRNETALARSSERLQRL